MTALASDLRWLHSCDVALTFDLQAWFAFCQADPKAARRLIRKVCTSQQARGQSFQEGSVMRLQNHFSCSCGKVLASRAAYSAHQSLVHDITPPANYYAEANGFCRCCLANFSNRGLLINHLQRGSRVCLLNLLLRFQLLSEDEEKAQRALAAPVKLCDLRAGRPAHYATVPVMRVHGPSNLLLDVHGNTISATSKLHPHGGQGKRIAPWLEFGEIW